MNAIKLAKGNFRDACVKWCLKWKNIVKTLSPNFIKVMTSSLATLLQLFPGNFSIIIRSGAVRPEVLKCIHFFIYTLILRQEHASQTTSSCQKSNNI